MKKSKYDWDGFEEVLVFVLFCFINLVLGFYYFPKITFVGLITFGLFVSLRWVVQQYAKSYIKEKYEGRFNRIHSRVCRCKLEGIEALITEFDSVSDTENMIDYVLQKTNR